MSEIRYLQAAAAPARATLLETRLLGDSDAFKYLQFRLDQVAPTSATVLLLGETGTGKNVVARIIHERSPNRAGQFVAVNCAAIPATLLESELFGHERGAFTDARTSQAGRFEVAHKGTLFLDEIGELPMETQAKLLRVLQEGQFERLGSTRTMTVQARVIAATNRDLRAEVRAGRFRRDLYFRLNVFPITVPPLRERREDIRPLAQYFVERLADKHGRTAASLSNAVLEQLESYPWPGNVRELENVLERAVITCNGGPLTLAGLLDRWDSPIDDEPASLALEDVERSHIARVLAMTHWRIQGRGGAAHLLRLKASTLRSRMQKLGIRRDIERSSC
jgi:formate hydrogenlyase transcriptional activator